MGLEPRTETHKNIMHLARWSHLCVCRISDMCAGIHTVYVSALEKVHDSPAAESTICTYGLVAALPVRARGHTNPGYTST